MDSPEFSPNLPLKQLRSLAQQGDLPALTHLLNQALAHKQITTQVQLQDQVLKIILKSAEIPDPDIALVLIDRALTKLHSPLIQTIQVETQDFALGQTGWVEEFQLGTYHQISPKVSQPIPSTDFSRDKPKNSSRNQWRSLDSRGWSALITGLILAVFILNIPFLTIIPNGFLTLVHELGHTIAHWLFGRPAIPTVDIIYGGGLTITLEQSGWIIALIYGCFGFLFFYCRAYRFLIAILTGITLLYTFCLMTAWNHIIAIFMGHGMELIAVFICLYLGATGYFCSVPGDRTIYSMLGFLTWFRDLQFSFKLLFDSDFREWYELGKGGILDNDFVTLANQYLNVDLSQVVWFFFIGCFVAPGLALGIFFYEKKLLNLLQKLV